MVKNALKMSKWFSVLLPLSLISISSCNTQLDIVQRNKYGFKVPVPSTIEATAGSNLTVICITTPPVVAPKLIWGRRNKELRFKNETDLVKLAKTGSKQIYDLLNESNTNDEATKKFLPLKLSDRGVYFCGSLKEMVFKIIHIKVKENYFDSSPTCNGDKFRCIESGRCINWHYKCDGTSDCSDGSDEDWDLCSGDPCAGKILCADGRCIPTSWCCNKITDDNCTVAIRPKCCPPLPDPYDPVHFYDNQNIGKEIHKSNGPRYIFITICVVSAILSFVLFLFVISKICGFDAKPNRSRNTTSNALRNQTTTFSNRCEHSECAIRREFNPDSTCLYCDRNSNNEVADPLIAISTFNTRAEMFDQPPPYAEVATAPPSIDKCVLDDLLNEPPPPYSSTKIFRETEIGNGNNVCASGYPYNISNNYSNNARCDIGITGDRINSE